MELPSALLDQMESLKAGLSQHAETEVIIPSPPTASEPATIQAPQVPAQISTEQEIPITPVETLSKGAQMLSGSPASSAPDADWKHKYDVINGKYVAETARLREEKERLEAELANAKAEMERKPVSTEVSDDSVRSQIKPELIEEFGMDFWKQNLALRGDEERIRRIEQSVAQKDHQRFLDDLSSMVPDWQAINGSREWNDFLSGTEELTGNTYENILIDAASRYDAKRVSQMLNRFKAAKTQSPVSDRVTIPGISPGTNGKPVPKMSMDQFEAEMKAITASGLSPMEQLARQKELITAFNSGAVDVPAGGNASPRGFV